MPYDADLAERVQRCLLGNPDIVCKKMFGGLAFMVRGHMCVGVWQSALIVRVGAAAYLDALAEPFTEEFDVTGRPLTGFVLVALEGVETDAALEAWISRGLSFAAQLPAK